jgi:hypothetical protein
MTRTLLKALRAMALGTSMILVANAGMAADTSLPLGTLWKGDAPAGTPAWVNVLFRTFTDVPTGNLGSYEWIRNTVEVQITTDGILHDDPTPSCCPVQGKGNLTGRENLEALYLNLNPRLNIHKLKIYWTGAPMSAGPSGSNVFPAPGLPPSKIDIGSNDFEVGKAGKFDIELQWDGNKKLGPSSVSWSKLLFVYDDGNEVLLPSDIQVVSRNPRSGLAPFVAVGHIKHVDGDDDAWIK